MLKNCPFNNITNEHNIIIVIIAIFIEGAFSMWAGFRGYDYMSQQSTDSYHAVSEIPLVKGRSHISETLCRDWMDITQNQIPTEFWDLHKQGCILRDDKTWTAFQQFAINCQKRQHYEQRIRKQQPNIQDSSTTPINLPTKVPQTEDDLN